MAAVLFSLFFSSRFSPSATPKCRHCAYPTSLIMTMCELSKENAKIQLSPWKFLHTKVQTFPRFKMTEVWKIKTNQCQLLTLAASGRSSTIHLGSPSPHFAIFNHWLLFWKRFGKGQHQGSNSGRAHTAVLKSPTNFQNKARMPKYNKWTMCNKPSSGKTLIKAAGWRSLTWSAVCEAWNCLQAWDCCLMIFCKHRGGTQVGLPFIKLHSMLCTNICFYNQVLPPSKQIQLL